MKRLPIAAASALALAVMSLPAATTALADNGYGHALCEKNALTCTELNQQIAGYTGHDEPSTLFYSNGAGSGNDNTYTLVLPTDPPTAPAENGTGGTANFQL